MSIHEWYQSNNDQTAFLRAARDFLVRRDRQSQLLLQPPNKQQQQSSTHDAVVVVVGGTTTFSTSTSTDYNSNGNQRNGVGESNNQIAVSFPAATAATISTTTPKTTLEDPPTSTLPPRAGLAHSFAASLNPSSFVAPSSNDITTPNQKSFPNPMQQQQYPPNMASLQQQSPQQQQDLPSISSRFLDLRQPPPQQQQPLSSSIQNQIASMHRNNNGSNRIGEERTSPNMESLERGMFSLLSDDDDDPVIAMPSPILRSIILGGGGGSSAGPLLGSIGTSTSRPMISSNQGSPFGSTPMSSPHRLLPSQQQQQQQFHLPPPQQHIHLQQQQQLHLQQHQQRGFLPPPQQPQLAPVARTPPRGPPGLPMSLLQPSQSSPFPSTFVGHHPGSNSNNIMNNNNTGVPTSPTSTFFNLQQHAQQQQQPFLNHHQQRQPTPASTPTNSAGPLGGNWGGLQPQQQQQVAQQSSGMSLLNLRPPSSTLPAAAQTTEAATFSIQMEQQHQQQQQQQLQQLQQQQQQIMQQRALQQHQIQMQQQQQQQQQQKEQMLVREMKQQQPQQQPLQPPREPVMLPPRTTPASTSRDTSPTPETPTRPSTASSIDRTPNSSTATPQIPPTPATVTKKEYQPKRLWTRFEEQPGRILANNVAASHGTVVDLRPRQELTAKWMLPLSYLRQRSAEKQNNASTIRDALAHLAVGLFRRGCTENGTLASIVSKEVCLAPPDHGDGGGNGGSRSSDYPFQVINNETVVGTVPFYSPRTPGHVVFRLYWQDDPLATLATGPTLNVRVTEDDFESSIRFILSNFKAKKVNPTSLSSLYSLALVLDQFQLSHLKNNNNNNLSSQHQQQLTQQLQQRLEGAGRAVWGCICEARKVLDACAAEYSKTTSKLEKLEEAVDELKAKVEEEVGTSVIDTEEELDLMDAPAVVAATGELLQEGQESSLVVLALREKQKALLSGRASCERKWRDSQLAFASILKAVVTSPSISLLLRRELVTKMRLEYELWCPLCEEFAIPSSNGGELPDSKMMWYDPLSAIGHAITTDHFRMCIEARSKMQLRILGFDPSKQTMEAILYPPTNNPPRGRPPGGAGPPMNPSAVNVFNQLSAAVGQLYQEVYNTSDRVHRQREFVRSRMEEFVQMCEEIPHGTKVVVFGSAANGFGYVSFSFFFAGTKRDYSMLCFIFVFLPSCCF
jgi:hypothetical protein